MTEIPDIDGLLRRFDGLRILVVGDVMLDRYVSGSVERMSPEAPVPVLRVAGERVMPGGAANVARNVAALGGRAILCGVVGTDDAGRTLTRLLADRDRIDARMIDDSSRPTTQKTRFVADRQQLLRTDRETAEWLAAPIVDRLIASIADAAGAADAIVLSDYAKGTLTDAVIRAALDAASAADLSIIADPKSRDFARYRGVDLLTPNRRELIAASGQPCDSDTALAAAAQAAMKAAGLPAMLVTRGGDGMSLLRKGEPALHIAAERQEVFDASGAGDTVVAALALGLAGNASLPTAAAFANLAAGLVVGKAGTAVAEPGEISAASHARAVLRSADAKILPLPAALQRVAAWRSAGERIGFTNGCFDLIHPGHVALLAQAKAACDRLVVALNGDRSVARLKGSGRPIQPESARAIVLASLTSVDLVVGFEEDTPIDLIHAIRPDLLVKGADYRPDQVVGAAFVESHGGRVLLVPLLPGNSTTRTIDRVSQGAGR